ncbi:MAG: transglycosylase SLT domain-containing protein [Burkholderiaceae bacterium]
MQDESMSTPLDASVRQLADQAAKTGRAFARLLRTLHHSLMLLGGAAIAALAIMYFNPTFADRLIALSPYAADEAADDADEPPETLATTSQVTSPAVAVAPLQSGAQSGPATAASTPDRQQQLVTDWISKRYRVARDATAMLVSAAYVAAHETRLDPLLILAVVAIESGFNPFAESAVGAQGLMQVMAKLHHDKFRQLGGVKAALNPVANIKVGSRILKEYVRRGGSVEAGLKLYVGAAAFDSDEGYGSKVMAEYKRLKDVAVGKNVPIVVTASRSGPPPNLHPAAPVAEPAKPAEPPAEARADRQPFRNPVQQSVNTPAQGLQRRAA